MTNLRAGGRAAAPVGASATATGIEATRRSKRVNRRDRNGKLRLVDDPVATQQRGASLPAHRARQSTHSDHIQRKIHRVVPRFSIPWIESDSAPV